MSIGLFGAAFAIGGDENALATTASTLVRPVALPFLWRSLVDASSNGDAREAWERAQLLLLATPGWADGHSVFAYRFALDGGDTVLPPLERVLAARDRLRLSLRFLEDARANCKQREIQLLSDMAWLVELAVRNEPEIAPQLGVDPAVLIDGYLAQAEALGAGRMVREQRLYEVPRLCAAMLAAGDRARALAVLDSAIDRASQQPDPALNEEWRTVLQAVRRDLDGSNAADPEGRTARKADPRLQPLAPFLR
ncbi:MAG: hypothetical protein ABL997_14975 [Planctomycetota bacterium]